ncbi:MAG: hypothetical protein JW803_08665 [Endomicrobiales bacterium]|nr:hypothetical protein [Endomicrobiales bacterium]
MNFLSGRRRTVLLFLAVILFFAVNSFAQKEAKGGIEAKIALETSLENRVRRVLQDITGTEKIIVIINVQLISEKTDNEAAAKNKEQDDDFILPGVPIKQAISEKQVGDAVMAALGDDTRTMIKKLSATIILDKSVSQSVVKVVNEVATGLLGIDAERGDQLVIKQIHFQKNPFYWGSLLYPPNIYWILLIIAAVTLTAGLTLFLFGPFKVFTRDFAQGVLATASALKEGSAASEEAFFKAGGGEDLTAVPSEPGKGTTGIYGKGEPLFSFVNAGNIDSFIYLIKDEKPDTIAAVMNYLDAELSAKVLASVALDKQREVGAMLSKVTELDPSEIDEIEANLKKRIGYLAGGADRIVKVLDYADERTKNTILAQIKSANPSEAEQINKSLITIDVISTFDVTALQTVIKAVSPAVFSQILKTMNEALREKVLNILPAGAAARLKQEMELGRPFSAARLEMEKRRVVDTIRRMEARGLITR